MTNVMQILNQVQLQLGPYQAVARIGPITPEEFGREVREHADRAVQDAIKSQAIGMLNSIAGITGTHYCTALDQPVHQAKSAPRDCQTCYDVRINNHAHA